MGGSQLSPSGLPRDLFETCWSFEASLCSEPLAARSREACRRTARLPAAGRFAAQPGQPPSCPVRGEFLIPAGACFSSLRSDIAILGGLWKTRVARWLLKRWEASVHFLHAEGSTASHQQRKSFLSALPPSSQHPILFREAFCSQAARPAIPGAALRLEGGGQPPLFAVSAQSTAGLSASQEMGR